MADEPEKDFVFAATAHVFRKGFSESFTDKAREAFRASHAQFEALDTDELAAVLMAHILLLGRRLVDEKERANG
jgi:predicted P-loop ATPase